MRFRTRNVKFVRAIFAIPFTIAPLFGCLRARAFYYWIKYKNSNDEKIIRQLTN